MPGIEDRIAELSPEQRALLEKRLAGRPAAEPIAVLGLGCRFPGGGDGPQAFWRLLENRVDAISQVPGDRWDVDALFDADPEAAGRLSSRWGGFLDGVADFDAAFFGISPREATRMDPQQRLWLEVAWEALEDAGQAIDTLAGSPTGVFVGVHSHSSDYLWLQYMDPEGMDSFTGPGTAHNFLAGRLSYLLDLQGPSFAVDTACSSSLLAVHLACQSLRAGESRLAVAGGVNLMLTPHFSIAASRMRMLAPDGRCKAFDARADGFVRGEGCGVVVLKRLADALAAGDPIRAVIRGSASNQDGRTNGVTAPNGLAQQQVIRLALKDAGVGGELIGYVEAHGTGTALGDPIEVEALAATVGKGAEPCVIGSVKTNLGHLEGAAGIAGLIKAVLVLEAERIPANLHFTGLNPHIDLAGTRLAIATAMRPWPRGAAPRRAAVSSFGWSGTNVHVVLEEAPLPPAAEERATDAGTLVLPISARSAAALGALARAHHDLLADEGAAVADICRTAGLRRSHHGHRLAVTGASAQALRSGLAAFMAREASPSLATGRRPEAGPPGVVFVFPGQGSQRLGMGRELLATSPAFAQALRACDEAVETETGWSVIAELEAAEDRSRLAEIDVVQPLLFSIQIALVALWRSLGIVPDAVVGHSMGEVAAAHVAGALDLASAARVICRRSRLLRRVSGRGAMAVVGLALAEARHAVAGLSDRLSVAVSNGPTSTVLSGEPAALEQLMEGLRARDVFCRPVQVDVASHSPQVDGLLPDLLAALDGLVHAAPVLPFYSTVTGAPEKGPAFSAAYWARNLREPVLFHAAVRRLIAAGHGTFIEMSAHPLLTAPVEAALHEAAREGTAIGSLSRERGEREAIAEAVARLYAAGHDPDWRAIQPAGGRCARLPRYPWQRQRYWVDAAPAEMPAWTRVSGRADRPSPHASAERYRLDWVRKARGPGGPAAPAGDWLLLADRGGLARRLAACLEACGGRVVVVGPGEDRETLGDRAWDGVVDLEGLDLAGVSDAEAAVRACESLARTLQRRAGRLFVVTRGAEAVAAGEGPSALAASALWGFARVAALEEADTWGGLLDLDPAGTADEADALAQELLAGDGEDQVAFRRGERLVPRLVPVAAGPAAAPLALRPDGTWLVTGGLGGLGLAIAGWLVDRGARHLVLLGRTGLPPRASWDGEVEGRIAARIAAVRALEARGAAVEVVAADVADRQALGALFSGFGTVRPPLRGIVHAAGVLASAPAAEMTADLLRQTFRPKLEGALVLSELSRAQPIECMVLFSSGAGIWGSRGLAHYGAANHALDAFAHARRAEGLPALSIDWGWWAGGGMDTPEVEAFFREVGLAPMPAEGALAALEAALAAGSVQEVVAAVDWGTFKPIYEARRPRPLLAEIAVTATATAAAAEDRLAGMSRLAPAARREAFRQLVAAEVAGVLGFDSGDAVEPRLGFFKMGMDSILTVRLRGRLERAVGRALAPTLAFEYPTVETLGDHLLSIVFPSEPEAHREETPPAEVEAEDQDLSEEQLTVLLAAKLQSRA